MEYKGKVAFITGGANGAGLGQAKVFGRAGCRIFIVDIRKDALDAAIAELRAEGIDAHGAELDLTDREAYARVADECEQVMGETPSFLFNTAGVNSFGPTEASTYEDFDWLLGVNLGGVVNGMVTWVPRMIKAGKGGYIVSTSSLGAFGGGDGAAIYSAAKAAVVSLMESYNAALKKYGIGVSVLCPANIKSNIGRATEIRPAHLGKTGYVVNEETKKSLESIHAHGKDPEELAQNVKDAIERDQLYIIPYPESKPMIEARLQAIVDAVMPLEEDAEGARVRTEALMNWGKERGGMFAAKSEDANA